MYRLNLVLILQLFLFPAYGQLLHGSVRSLNQFALEESVPGATVFWKGTTVAVQTDSVGNFGIVAPDSLPAQLIVSMPGFISDTLKINSLSESVVVNLKSAIQLKEVQVSSGNINYSLLKPLNTEMIGQNDLLKAACCNISESFSSSASVDVAFTDAVSGAKKIQLLGLDGVYTQLLSENMPLFRGLSAAYGLNYIPGTWIKTILVTKGTGSVVNGYESISGQINLDFLHPEELKKRLFVNAYVNQRGRTELNVHLGKKINEKWSTLLFTHASKSFLKEDMNKDGFLDMPLMQQYTAFNRWNYHSGKHLEAQFGVKGVYEDRIGGQVSFDPKYRGDSVTGYGIVINNRQLEYFSKTGLVFPATPYKSVGLQTSGKWQLADLFFGLKRYKAEETNWYANLIGANIIGSTTHKYKLGASFLYDDYRKKFQDSSFFSTEIVPGAFFEYTYTPTDHLTLVAGVRADEHNLYGLQLTPRLHLRYQPFHETTVRISGGRGFRTAHVFIENQAVLASARKVIIAENFLPEVAWNYGISLNQAFHLFANEAYVNVDFFRTDFENQIVMDLDRSAQQVYFSNLHGSSFSNSLQLELGFEPLESFAVKMAYKWYDVKTTYSEGLASKPYIPDQRVMINLSYSTYRDIWKFDLTANWFGASRIPLTAGNPEKYALPERSLPYALLQAQITKKFRKFDWYLGGENLLNQVQKNPVLAADQPFGNYFDASMVYAPVEGTVIYSGIRFEIK